MPVPSGALSQPAREESLSNSPFSCTLGPTEADPEMEFGYKLSARGQPQRQGGGQDQAEGRPALLPEASGQPRDSGRMKLPLQKLHLGPQRRVSWVCT